MSALAWEQRFEAAQETIRALQDELAETNRGLLALTMELEERVEERTAELRAAHEELERTNSELLQLTLELDDRVAARTAELQAKDEEIRAMSQQLWQAAKLATMGELVASIAHELNNPLATVSLRVEMLLGQMAPDAPQRRALKVVEHEAERMGQLVGNLLQFTRRGQQQVSALDVREEIECTLELIHYHLRNRHIAVVCQFAPDVPMVQADRQQIEIAISDTGMGIAAEDLPRVMEPFFTTKPEGRGTGLGLPICRRIVQEHQGALYIVSTVYEGTTVLVTLPTQHRQNRASLIEA